ncbi:hypothetical protein [Arthrospira sp. PCC 8006]
MEITENSLVKSAYTHPTIRKNTGLYCYSIDNQLLVIGAKT